MPEPRSRPRAPALCCAKLFYLISASNAARSLMEIRNIQPFLHYFGTVRERTMRVARCIPPDKIDWSYAPGKFTLGDLLRHIAVTERYLFAENIRGGTSRYVSLGKELADGLDNVLFFMDRLHQESMEIFSRLSDGDLKGKCRNVGGTDMTVWKWLRAMTEHEIHPRGQIYLYLGILGVPTPPLYGLTSEGGEGARQSLSGKLFDLAAEEFDRSLIELRTQLVALRRAGNVAHGNFDSTENRLQADSRLGREAAQLAGIPRVAPLVFGDLCTLAGH